LREQNDLDMIIELLVVTIVAQIMSTCNMKLLQKYYADDKFTDILIKVKSCEEIW